ncbi:ATP-binding protein [Teredinibacter haidensis]|uniref:ATP-binding protein n=1 Tax=Teredinibacter haidensis TaxID=2731755 RepID=UPI00094916FA|nr:ATP-binding protein [Teredinibacter haidensis]
MLQLAQNQTGSRKKILYRILVLRAIALAIAFSVLAVFQFMLERPLDYPLLYGITFAAALYSAVTLLRLQSLTPVTDVELFFHLLMDALILLVLVAFSGRATNPFIYYLLVLVAISATIFTRAVSWVFAGLAVIAYTALLYLDLEEHIHHLFSDFQLHLIGMWVNFVGSTLLMHFFVSLLATALRDREVLLARSREETLKNEQLVAIGTLAASTVHALGTPLSTMAVMLGEMKQDTEVDLEDIGLLLGQVERCKQTMSKLSTIASNQESEYRVSPVAELFDDLEEHYHLLSPVRVPNFSMDSSVEQAQIHHSLLLLYALINLVDNAVRAAQSRVEVSAKVAGHKLQIKIKDDGHGMPADMVENFGKPNFSRQEGGLGIGIFLSNTTIEKLNGKIVLFNPSESRDGKTTVLVELPLANEDDK